MRWAASGEAPGLGFDRGAEGVVAKGPLLLQVGTDFGERVFVQCLGQQCPVGLRALGIGASERQPAGVGYQACTRALAGVDGAAAPAP